MIFDIPSTAIAWLAHGERGVSSEAIFSYLTGGPINGRLSPPYDTGDLRRCRRLLHAVPEFAARIGEMRNVSSQWAALVDRWDELCALMDENPSDAYALMCELIDGTKRAKGTGDE
jgi:hypothetical protein